MKTIVYAVATISLLAVPLASFAQSPNEPITRAQVRQQLIEIERAGYNPAMSDDAKYPADIQAAEARVAASKQGVQPATSPASAGQ